MVRRDTAHTAAVLAGPGALCVSVRETAGTGSLNCTPDPVPNAAGQRPLVTEDKTEDGWRVTALVPDGTTDARLSLPGGAEQALEITNNFISTETSGGVVPTGLSYVKPSGETQTVQFTSLNKTS